MTDRPDTEPSSKDLEYLYRSLSSADKTELLEELLVARAMGIDTMAATLDVWLLDAALKELVDSHDRPG